MKLEQFSARYRASYKAWCESHTETRGFRAARSGDALELDILDVIGFDWWTGGGITTADIKAQLDEASDVREIRVVIDSPGGSVFDGIGIFNVLRRHDARVVTEIVGLAASAASVIAMAGDEVQMHVGTEMMIHQASGMTWGNADDHDATAKALRSIDGSLVDIYVNQTSKEKDAIAQLVNDETWMSASEAVEMGFATKLLTESGTKKRKATATATASAPAAPRPTASAVGYRPLRGLI